MVTSELLLHPVRMRIVQVLYGGHPATTTQLRAALPEVSPAAIYRHVARLAAAEVIEVVAERRVRGAVERTYRLRREAMELDPETFAAMTPDDHRRAFGAFAASLLADFDRYLATTPAPADPRADHVSYRQAALWLDDNEAGALLRDLRQVVTARMANAPTASRRRMVLSVVALPSPPVGPYPPAGNTEPAGHPGQPYPTGATGHAG
ncbi:helix-turn-helix domain-containing protein [Micromonospora craniellae]|uniref:ArsR family transcriptional regulator n=1 Tax=Micromonospora craniellae TaxID=2294034 RepID=A0A372FY19_9ACTN|nr:helix-turn-helix domain-containing protein [Micromonospora craniellae]RFS45633.1 ArsR family transcriptional regulator [Micromonospora craniellae]